MCTECGTAPDIIVLMDATSSSFRKEFLQWKVDKAPLRVNVDPIIPIPIILLFP